MLLEHYLSKSFDQFKELPQEKSDILNRDLPDIAFKQHPTKAFLTTINAAYIFPILNDAFGIGGWVMDATAQNTKIKEGDKTGESIVAKVEFFVPQYGIYRSAYGGNNNPDVGDAYKGAVTDAFTKICSTFMNGVAKVWRNEVGKKAENKTVAKPWLNIGTTEWKVIKDKYKSVEEVKKDYNVANSTLTELEKIFI